MINFLDLFSGIGGFALGAYRAGLRFNNHYFSEVDSYAIRVYQQRFPDSIGLGDITKVKGETLTQGDWIISGGFPCQDISVAGKGAGLAGSRSGLWFEYARIIGELRPRYSIMENVGALSFRGLDAVLGSLAEIGYDAEWQDIRASDVGAPHRRERLWIVAYPSIDARDARRSESAGLVGETGITSRSDDVAYPYSEQPATESEWPKRTQGTISKRCRADMVNPNRQRCEEQPDGLAARPWNADRESCGNDVSDTKGPERKGVGRDSRERRPESRRGSWWSTEPDVGRVANGIPSRVDRLKCLGNAVVPQQAYPIFAAIAEIERGCL